MIHAPKSRMKVLFSTRDHHLFDWVEKTIGPFAAADSRVQIHLALTSKKTVPSISNHNANKELEELEEGYTGVDDEEEEVLYEHVTVKYGHYDFDEEIEAGTVVFTQASKALQEHIETVCRKKNLRSY